MMLRRLMMGGGLSDCGCWERKRNVLYYHFSSFLSAILNDPGCV